MRGRRHTSHWRRSRAWRGSTGHCSSSSSSSGGDDDDDDDDDEEEEEEERVVGRSVSGVAYSMKVVVG